MLDFLLDFEGRDYEVDISTLYSIWYKLHRAGPQEIPAECVNEQC